ncbi:MAG: IS1096 element passenger TnpR family protein [Desulfitobacteriaceae bacterium]
MLTFRNYPECLEGLGNTPPEDVGGEDGYDEFLQAISDPHHPEYQDMLSWGRMQRYENFNLEFVNRRLKTVLRGVWER